MAGAGQSLLILLFNLLKNGTQNILSLSMDHQLPHLLRVDSKDEEDWPGQGEHGKVMLHICHWCGLENSTHLRG